MSVFGALKDRDRSLETVSELKDVFFLPGLSEA